MKKRLKKLEMFRTSQTTYNQHQTQFREKKGLLCKPASRDDEDFYFFIIIITLSMYRLNFEGKKKKKKKKKKRQQQNKTNKYTQRHTQNPCSVCTKMKWGWGHLLESLVHVSVH